MNPPPKRVVSFLTFETFSIGSPLPEGVAKKGKSGETYIIQSKSHSFHRANCFGFLIAPFA